MNKTYKMDSQSKKSTGLNLEMESLENYRALAKTYRSSDEYSKMIDLYPALQTSIKDCRNERLVA
tara:strand:- start:549 stop:743 length:195 start_codon:yes stop_codon:yes gene_type:complete